MSRRGFWVCLETAAAFTLAAMGGAAHGATSVLLHQPSIRGDTLAFIYQGEVWTSSASGQAPRQLTNDGFAKSDPQLSPDGQRIAYTRDVAGNTDVYTISIDGGPPSRITWHPMSDEARGWSPDGRLLLVASRREPLRGKFELFTVPADGGAAQRLPVGKSFRGALSANGDQLAHTASQDPPLHWKKYRGGQAPFIWLTDLASLSHQKIPHTRASDTSPQWVRGQVYFRSDRAGTFGIYRYDPVEQTVSTVLAKPEIDVDSLSGDGETLVFSSLGELYRLDPLTGRESRIQVHTPRRKPGPAVVDVSARASRMALAPDGRTLAVEARGDIFIKSPDTIATNISRSPQSAERSPVWSPDGKSLAYVSDASGESDILVHTLSSQAPLPLRVREKGVPFSLTWSPDGRRLAYLARDQAVWVRSL